MHELPPEIAQEAVLRDNEYAWRVESFPKALAAAQSLGYACLGGQFQFRLQDAIYELYWVNADSNDRLPQETWPAYSQRSCFEVMEAFHQRLQDTDFIKLAHDWTDLRVATERGLDPMKALVFVAYFVNEVELTGLAHL
jgi:hypothetical protein